MSVSFGRAYAQATLSSEASALLPACYRDDARMRAVADAVGAKPLPPESKIALLRANPSVAGDGARASARAKLDDDRVLCVVTGQQIGLFGGPLYSLWKAATAIVVARRMEASLGRPVVPVFWLQTEDHDLAEIAETAVSDTRGGVHVAQVSSDDGHSRSSVGARTLGDDIAGALATAESALAGRPHYREALTLIRESYRAGQTWTAAFIALVHRVFAGTELMVFDPRARELSARVAPIHRWALNTHTEIAEALAARGQELRNVGFDEQVPTRSDCALSFYHPQGPDGPRYRLREQGDAWVLADGSDVPRVVEVPTEGGGDERFSTSALLRPLTQQVLLPTLAYVGGPGEISYWAQLPPLFALAELPFPLVIPRAGGVVVSGSVRADLTGLGLAAADVQPSVQATLAIPGPPDGAPSFVDLCARVGAACREVLDDYRPSANELDPSLSAAFERTEATIARNVEKLQQRLEKAALQADPERVEAVRRVVASLWPKGKPQERVLCWPDLCARVGVDRVAPLLISAISSVPVGGDRSSIEVYA